MIVILTRTELREELIARNINCSNIKQSDFKIQFKVLWLADVVKTIAFTDGRNFVTLKGILVQGPLKNIVHIIEQRLQIDKNLLSAGNQIEMKMNAKELKRIKKESKTKSLEKSIKSKNDKK
jgi:hypothetical protein